MRQSPASPNPATGLRTMAATLASPAPSLLAALIKARVRGEDHPAALPPGVDRDLRPTLPRVGGAALALYARRKAVDSYPLIFTCLALAHPN